MKKIVLLYAIAAFIASSCTDLQEAPEISGVPMVLTAYQEGTPDTKTAVEDGGKQVFWEPGDEIKVFSGSRSGRFTSNVTGLTEVTEFTGRLEGDEPDVADIWAVYPYSDEASFDGESITTVIPSVQVARPGTFAQGANVAIAHSATTNLQFYNVGGGIRFSLTETGVKKVIFEGLGGEVISGTVKVGFEEDQPKVKEVSSGSMFITLLPPEGESFATGTWYYLTAIPGALNSGFKLRFYKDDDTYAKVVSEKAMSIKRKIFGSLANADTHIAYEATTTSFPESVEDIQASEELANEIGASLSIIMNNYEDSSQMDIEEVAAEVSILEGVQEVVINEGKTTISIRQADGIWLNASLSQHDESLSEDYEAGYTETIINNKQSTRNIRGANDYQDSQALILAPFQSDFKYHINDMIQDLVDAGYSRNNIHCFQNDEADITKFKGTFLDDFSFIAIITHGCVGYTARKPITGSGVPDQTALTSSTKYSSASVQQLLDSGMLDLSEVALVSTDKYKTWRLAMTPHFLKGASFNNSCVLLSACESATNMKEGTDKGSMVWNLINCGVGAVTGFNASVYTDVARPTIELMTRLISHGVSFQDSYDYVVKTERMANMCNSYILTTDCNNHDCDIPLIFKKQLKNEEAPYYLTTPTITQYQSINGANVELSWDCDLNAFSFSWPAFTKDKIYYPDDLSASYSINYDIYINDKWVASRKANYLQLTDCLANNYRWSVVANITDGDTVISSFSSDTKEFSISSVYEPFTIQPADIAVKSPGVSGETGVWGKNYSVIDNFKATGVYKSWALLREMIVNGTTSMTPSRVKTELSKHQPVIFGEHPTKTAVISYCPESANEVDWEVDFSSVCEFLADDFSSNVRNDWSNGTGHGRLTTGNLYIVIKPVLDLLGTKIGLIGCQKPDQPIDWSIWGEYDHYVEMLNYFQNHTEKIFYHSASIFINAPTYETMSPFRRLNNMGVFMEGFGNVWNSDRGTSWALGPDGRQEYTFEDDSYFCFYRKWKEPFEANSLDWNHWAMGYADGVIGGFNDGTTHTKGPNGVGSGGSCLPTRSHINDDDLWCETSELPIGDNGEATSPASPVAMGKFYMASLMNYISHPGITVSENKRLIRKRTLDQTVYCDDAFYMTGKRVNPGGMIVDYFSSLPSDVSISQENLIPLTTSIFKGSIIVGPGVVNGQGVSVSKENYKSMWGKKLYLSTAVLKQLGFKAGDSINLTEYLCLDNYGSGTGNQDDAYLYIDKKEFSVSLSY